MCYCVFDVRVRRIALFALSGEWIVADVALPRMKKLYIYGTLELNNSRDFTVDVYYIVIQGGRLVIGEENDPFNHKARIILRGDHSTPEISLPGVELGAKAIGMD